MANLHPFTATRPGLLAVGLTLLILVGLVLNQVELDVAPPLTAPEPVPLSDEARVQSLMMHFVTFPDGSTHRVLGVYVTPSDAEGESLCDAILEGRGRVPCQEVIDLAGSAAQ